MARYTGSVYRKARRLGFSVTETGKVFKTKEYTLDNYLYEEAVKLAGLKKYLKEFIGLTEIFNEINSAIQTKRDYLTIQLSKNKILEVRRSKNE